MNREDLKIKFKNCRKIFFYYGDMSKKKHEILDAVSFFWQLLKTPKKRSKNKIKNCQKKLLHYGDMSKKA